MKFLIAFAELAAALESKEVFYKALAGVFAGITGTLMLQLTEPQIPITWALAGALIFATSVAVILLLSPMLVNRMMMQIQREDRESRLQQIVTLKNERDAYRTENDLIKSQILKLEKISAKLQFDLETANEHILKLNEHDDPTKAENTGS